MFTPAIASSSRFPSGRSSGSGARTRLRAASVRWSFLGGGLDSKARLQLLKSTASTVLVCTPTYALRLAEVAKAEGISIRDSAVRVTIHAGEPGASIPAVRARIEDAWGARAFDHTGGTEVGAYGYSCAARKASTSTRRSSVARCSTRQQSHRAPKERGESWSSRTSVAPAGRRSAIARENGGGRDALVRVRPIVPELPGGVVGRTDDLIVLRGINVFPSAMEAIVRTFEVDEFRMVRTRKGALEELTIEVEASDAVAEKLAIARRERLAVRIPTRMVPAGSLPRWELKAKRVVDSQ